MFESEIGGERQLNAVADAIEDWVDGYGPNTVRHEIERTVERLFAQEVVPEAQKRARKHVGGYASTIQQRKIGWVGNEYRHGLGSTNVVVNSHEYGTGRRNMNGNGTMNATSNFTGRLGYRIPARTDAGPVSFESNGQTHVFEYVVHPGVTPKQFMQRTVEDKADDVAEAVASEVVDALDDQLDF